MTRIRRLLKIAKWTAVGLSLLSLAAWVSSVVGIASIPLTEERSIWFPVVDGYSLVFTGGGVLIIKYWPISPLFERRRFEWTRLGLDRLVDSGSGPAGHIDPSPRWFWVALWFPTLLCLITATAFFRMDRRIPPGHCRCGYNLTGNTSGRCPECGTEITGAHT